MRLNVPPYSGMKRKLYIFIILFFSHLLFDSFNDYFFRFEYLIHKKISISFKNINYIYINYTDKYSLREIKYIWLKKSHVLNEFVL